MKRFQSTSFGLADKRSAQAALSATGGLVGALLSAADDPGYFALVSTRLTPRARERFVGSAMSVTFADVRLLRHLERLFVFRNAPSISSFLLTKPDVVSLLFEIWQKLGEFFPGTTCRLRLVTDDEGANTLLVEIPTTESLEQAMARLSSFDEGWWLGAMTPAKGKVVIDLSLE